MAALVRDDTYIICMSEHDDSEDKHGRLSMWRAYGGTAAVAFVLNPEVFVSDSDVLGATSSPVEYIEEAEMGSRLAVLAANISNNEALLRGIGLMRFEVTSSPRCNLERFARSILASMRSGNGVSSTTPQLQPSPLVKREIVSIRGMPQPICKIPLADDPKSGLFGAEIPNLVDRVIIGPSRHPVRT